MTMFKEEPDAKTELKIPDSFKLREVAEWVSQCGNEDMAVWLRHEAARSIKLQDLDRMIGGFVETIIREGTGRMSSLDLGKKVSEGIAKLTADANIPEPKPIPGKKAAVHLRSGGDIDPGIHRIVAPGGNGLRSVPGPQI